QRVPDGDVRLAARDHLVDARAHLRVREEEQRGVARLEGVDLELIANFLALALRESREHRAQIVLESPVAVLVLDDQPAQRVAVRLQADEVACEDRVDRELNHETALAETVDAAPRARRALFEIAVFQYEVAGIELHVRDLDGISKRLVNRAAAAHGIRRGLFTTWRRVFRR